MIQGDGVILWVDHGFDQNNWDLWKDKIITGLRINVEPLPIILLVATGMYYTLYPMIPVGNNGLNKLDVIILTDLW